MRKQNLDRFRPVLLHELDRHIRPGYWLPVQSQKPVTEDHALITRRPGRLLDLAYNVIRLHQHAQEWSAVPLHSPERSKSEHQNRDTGQKKSEEMSKPIV